MEKPQEFYQSSNLDVDTRNEIYVFASAYAEKTSIDFTYWLMTNCELSEDQTIWSYDSEDYSIEGVYEIFKNQ